MRRYVQITGAKSPTRFVKCRSIDQCLEVVEKEAERQPAGTVINLLQIEREVPKPLARWSVGKGHRLERGGYR